MPSPSINEATQSSCGPWWTYGHVWLVIAGPALVVVAGFATLYLAITRPDPVITTSHSRQGSSARDDARDKAASWAPAVQARNHAATGAAPGAPAQSTAPAPAGR